MARDVIYIFDKLTKKREELGEIQSDFNMSFVIDGTKDSMKVQVLSYKDVQIEPYTIVNHPKTSTWWVVSHDKVDRYQNESGFLYIHELQLLGAIELLNARDLTDCGFNDNLYNVGQFIERLFKLSNFEYTSDLLINSPTISLDKHVNFIKTFENYTLLSALREFLDAYNCCAKLTFTTQTSDNEVYINNAILYILSKTGNPSLTSHNISDFDDVRETKTLSKESFGTTVVSNAENVISSIAKTYPSTGGVLCSSNEYTITAQNAVIKLPSKVYKANWIAMCLSQAPIEIRIDYENGAATTQFVRTQLQINPLDKRSFDIACQKILDEAYDRSQAAYESIKDKFEQYGNDIFETIKKLSTVTLYDGINVNAETGVPSKGVNMPYFVEDIEFFSHADDEPFVFCDKNTKQCLNKPWTAIAWERGSDEISGFECFVPNTGRTSTLILKNLKYTDIQLDVDLRYYQLSVFSFSDSTCQFSMKTSQPLSNNVSQWQVRFNGMSSAQHTPHPQWVVNYYPMSDLKIKVDNDRDKNDIQLYNQNGKLSDNVALSKMINSYSKEISSNTITRFMKYTDYNDVPLVGSLVLTNGGDYVINNISLSMTQNETTSSANFNYYIETEITMSKYVSTKSLIVNPNTNIRDYGIPQNFNVKRKQTYRDFYEIAYTLDSSADTNYYMNPSKAFNFSHDPNEGYDFTCVMEIRTPKPRNGYYIYYYQLNTTVYDMEKMFIISLDFKDNNIIGYGCQNVWSGFQIEHIFQGLNNLINTPISYVDEDGRVEDIEILFMDNLALTTAYSSYLDSHSSDTGYTDFMQGGGTLYNYSVFIPFSVYQLCYGNETIMIKESNYYKDPLEVPVFEYICQCDDTLDVLIGDGIFKQHDKDFVYFYSFRYGSNLTQENALPEYSIEYVGSNVYSITNGASIEEITTNGQIHLRIRLFSATDYNVNTNTWYNDYDQPIAEESDLAIFRHPFNTITKEIGTPELVLIAKNIPEDNIIRGTGPYSHDELDLIINHYKLK